MKSIIKQIKSTATARFQEDLCLLKKWVEINSGTYNISGNRAMLEAVAERFSKLPGSGTIEAIPDHPDHPQPTTLQAVYRHRCREDAPVQVLLNGHLDTVFDKDHSFQMWTELPNEQLQGPGVTDMKGGIVILLAALEIFETAVKTPTIGWEILITCDEEVGSASSKRLLIESAKRNHLGITFESSLPDGKLVRKRMGVGYASAKVIGRPAHVGRNFREGRNAIVKLADWITKIHAVNDEIPGIIVNTGSINGGGPLNVVTEHAEAEFNLRVQDAHAEQQLFRRLEGIHASMQEDGFNCLWHAQLNRKAKEAGPAYDALFNAWNEAARALGQSLEWRDTGGGSDGNILQAEGLPIIDNLGMIGDKIHSPHEYALTHSISDRSALTATFLLKLSEGSFDLPQGKPFAHHIKQLQTEQYSRPLNRAIPSI